MDELESIPPSGDAIPGQPRPSRTFRRPSPRWLIVIGVVVAAVAAVALTRGGPPSPAERLADIQAFVADATTVRFEGTHESRAEEETTEVRVDSPPYTFRTEGTLRFPDFARVVQRNADSESELISTPEGLYERYSEPRDGLDGRRWSYWPRQKPEWFFPEGRDGPDFGILADYGGPPLSTAPERRELRDVVGDLRAPARVDDDTIRASLPLAALFSRTDFVDAMLDGRGSVQVELTSGPGGRLDRLQWKLDARRLEDDRRDRPDGSVDPGGADRILYKADVRFHRWNASVSTAPPDLADIDLTPTVSEEELAAVDWLDVLAPTTVPPEWMLSAASVFDQDGRQCPLVKIDYAPRREPGRPFPPGALNLRLMMTAAGCDASAYFHHGAASRPFVAGRYRGSVHRELTDDPDGGGGGEFLLVVLVIDQTQVMAESNLPEPELAAVLATLAPLDLTTQSVFQSIPPSG